MINMILKTVTQEDSAKQPTTSTSESPSSPPSKIPRASESSSSSSSTEETSSSSSCGSPAAPQWVRCAYFTRVRTVKGVAIEWETKHMFSPVRKPPQVFEAELSQESTIGSPPSPIDTRSQLSSPQDSQGEPEAHTPEPAVQVQKEERPRAATPDWLVTTDRGFRCVACCRVFLSREAFLVHAEHGVKEGFSCRVFYEEMLERQLPGSERRPHHRCYKLAQRYKRANMQRKIKQTEESCRHLWEKLKAMEQELVRLQEELLKLQRQEARQKKLRAAHPEGQRGKRLKKCH